MLPEEGGESVVVNVLNQPPRGGKGLRSFGERKASLPFRCPPPLFPPPPAVGPPLVPHPPVGRAMVSPGRSGIAAAAYLLSASAGYRVPAATVGVRLGGSGCCQWGGVWGRERAVESVTVGGSRWGRCC